MDGSNLEHQTRRFLVLVALFPSLCLGVHFFGNNKEYSVVIDAGSSSTKLLVSIFEKRSEKLRLVKDELYETFKPGLSDFFGDPEKVKDEMEKILKKAEGYVPRGKWEDTPVVFKGTAGFRLLSQDKREFLLEEVRKSLDNSKFKKVENPASVLSESDEGLFGWVAANVLLDRFHGSPDDMVAALDLGGVSTQITFPLTHALFKQFPLQVHWFPVSDKRVFYYTHSYMEMGLGATTVGVLSIDNPKGTATYNTPCVGVQDNGKAYRYNGNTYTVSSTSGEGHVDVKKCAELVSEYVKSFKLREYKPLPNYEIHAFNGYFYVLRDAGLIDAAKGGRVALSQIMDSANEVCHRSEPQEDPFLCLHILYVYTLLTEGYQISVSEEIMISNMLANHHINWAMGMAYYHLEFEQDRKRKEANSKNN